MSELSIAMLSIHSSPLDALGTQNNGGMSVVIRETTRELTRFGHSVDIYTIATDNCEGDVIPLHDRARLIHLDINKKPSKHEIYGHLPRYYTILNDFLSKEDRTYDVLHSHYWLSGRLGLWAQRDWDIPHVITYHTIGRLKTDSGPNENESNRRLYWEQQLSHDCHRSLVATAREKRNLIDQFQIEDSKISVVPFGVNTTRFNTMAYADAREAVGLDLNESVILFVGRFVRTKGIERLIEALSLMETPKEVRLVLIGGDGADSASTRHLKQHARKMGVRSRVTFKERVSQVDLAKYYNAADISTLPSYYESFGLVVLESLACGTPVVATPVGIADMIIRNGKNGAIVEKPSAKALAATFSAVLRWRRGGKLPPDKVRASALDYTWTRITRNICEQYLRTIDEKNGTNHT